MSDTSERIGALKIDRATATPSGGGRRWLLVPALRAARLTVAQALREF